MLTVYISGPMSGYKDDNYPAFYAAEKFLKQKGFQVINPARLGEALEKSGRLQGLSREEKYKVILDHDLTHLSICDAIYLLKNWHLSGGAIKERDLSIKHGLIQMFEPTKTALNCDGVLGSYSGKDFKPVQFHGINLGDYHSMLVEIVSLGMLANGSIEAMTKGAGGTDPLLIFKGHQSAKLQFIGAKKLDRFLVEAEMKRHKLDGYYFDVCSFRKVKATRGLYKLERNMLGVEG